MPLFGSIKSNKISSILSLYFSLYHLSITILIFFFWLMEFDIPIITSRLSNKTFYLYSAHFVCSNWASNNRQNWPQNYSVRLVERNLFIVFQIDREIESLLWSIWIYIHNLTPKTLTSRGTEGVSAWSIDWESNNK